MTALRFLALMPTATMAAWNEYGNETDEGGAASSSSPAATTLTPTTTLAPTTLAPTTLAPTTLAPTTLAPTTVAPVATTVAPGAGAGGNGAQGADGKDAVGTTVTAGADAEYVQAKVQVSLDHTPNAAAGRRLAAHVDPFCKNYGSDNARAAANNAFVTEGNKGITDATLQISLADVSSEVSSCADGGDGKVKTAEDFTVKQLVTEGRTAAKLTESLKAANAQIVTNKEEFGKNLAADAYVAGAVNGFDATKAVTEVKTLQEPTIVDKEGNSKSAGGAASSAAPLQLAASTLGAFATALLF